MTVYTRNFNSILGQMVLTSHDVTLSFKSAVDTMADLPESGLVGDAIITLDENHLFVYVDSRWADQGAYDINDLLFDRLMQGLS